MDADEIETKTWRAVSNVRLRSCWFYWLLGKEEGEIEGEGGTGEAREGGKEGQLQGSDGITFFTDEFWLQFGSCLSYYRQCNLVGSSKAITKITVKCTVLSSGIDFVCLIQRSDLLMRWVSWNLNSNWILINLNSNWIQCHYFLKGMYWWDEYPGVCPLCLILEYLPWTLVSSPVPSLKRFLVALWSLEFSRQGQRS